MVSSISVFEIEYGLSRKPEARTRIGPTAEQFFSTVRVLPLDSDSAKEAGRIRAELARQPIGSYDLLLAGIARYSGLILVTANTSEFSRVPGLAIENWELPFTATAPRP